MKWHSWGLLSSFSQYGNAVLLIPDPFCFLSSISFFFSIHLCPLLLFKNSFIALHSSLKGSLLQNHFKIHYTYLLLLLVILSHFLSLQFWRDLVSLRWVSLWLKSIWHNMHSSNLGKLQTNSGNDSISVRECLCWSNVKPACGHYKHPLLSLPRYWKNLFGIELGK